MDQNLFNYNDEDIDSVIEYSHKLLNRKFSDVMEEYNRSLYKSYDDYNDRVVSEVQDKAISMKGNMEIILKNISMATSQIVTRKLTLKK